MGLGYEGWIKVGGDYILGTGTSVPRARQRLDSGSGYGGDISGPSATMGVGLPYNFDYDQFDGSLSFDVSEDFYENAVRDWIFLRQTAKEVKFSTRKDNVQQFNSCFWNSIGISASDGGLCEGSIGFYAVERNAYTYGVEYPDLFGNGKEGNADGGGDAPICPVGGGFPRPLNPGATPNLNPIPYWNTEVIIGSTTYEFINWTMDFSQDVVKFFACEANTSAQAPKYLAVGPMGLTFSGSYMLHDGFLGDTITQIEVLVGGVSLKLRRLEANTEADDVQSPDALVPLAVEYTAYELAA